MRSETYWLLIILALLIGLALPTAVKERSFTRFFTGAFLAAAGMLLPLFTFLFSAFLVPDWKGACRCGWIDCFYVGKLALTPLVLFACAAFHAVEIRRVADRTRKWIVTGFFLGAIVSTVCLVFGWFCDRYAGPWLFVPFYVSVWYSIRAVQLMRQATFKPLTYVVDFLLSLPFWIAAWIWSREYYKSLPDQPPECFVVTAAMRGHKNLVGPFVSAPHRDAQSPANQQLTTLRQLESLWRARLPVSHAVFRRAYNRIGPVLAGRIRSVWRADVAYLCLKPVEFLARGIIGLTKLNLPACLNERWRWRCQSRGARAGLFRMEERGK